MYFYISVCLHRARSLNSGICTLQAGSLALSHTQARYFVVLRQTWFHYVEQAGLAFEILLL